MNNFEDWYHINNKNIIEYGGSGLLTTSLSNILISIFPSNNVIIFSIYFIYLI